jgi:hypothetical protein
VGSDARDDQHQANQVLATGQLVQERDAAPCRRDREQREHEAVRRAGQPRHRELVGEVGDHGRADADAESPHQPRRVMHSGPRGSDAEGRGRDGADRDREAEPVQGGAGAAGGHVGQPVADHDVEHEAEAVRGGQQQPDRSAGDPDLGEQPDAADRQDERRGVAPGAGAVRRQRDDAEELDPGHGRQREPVEGQVEGRVHGREDQPERDDQPPLTRPGRTPDRPRWTDQRQHEGRGGHPEPGDSERRQVHEQQHRERRPEVVERRSDHHQPDPGCRRVPVHSGRCHRSMVRRTMGERKAYL